MAIHASCALADEKIHRVRLYVQGNDTDGE
jgi:hypothetical protein